MFWLAPLVLFITAVQASSPCEFSLVFGPDEDLERELRRSFFPLSEAGENAGESMDIYAPDRMALRIFFYLTDQPVPFLAAAYGKRASHKILTPIFRAAIGGHGPRVRAGSFVIEYKSVAGEWQVRGLVLLSFSGTTHKPSDYPDRDFLALIEIVTQLQASSLEIPSDVPIQIRWGWDAKNEKQFREMDLGQTWGELVRFVETKSPSL